MIGRLRGVLVSKQPPELLIDVGGVGYRVQVTAATLSRLPADEPVTLFIHHHFWDDDQKLFGFRTKTERIAFEGLLRANGVGPSVALAVLATHSVDQLSRILAEDDVAALCEVPGVGKKTAQRLLVELKSTVVLPVLDGAADGSVPAGLGAAVGPESPLVDVREALVNLGYSSGEIRGAIAALGSDVEPGADSGQLLKQALLKLSGV